jgi:hypothetical protein
MNNNIQRSPETAESAASPGTVNNKDAANVPTGVVTDTHSFRSGRPTAEDFKRAAALLPNKDIHVPVVDLQFGSTTAAVTYRVKLLVEALELPSEDNKQMGVRINMEALEPMTSTNEKGQPKPMTKATGWVFRPFPFQIIGKKGLNEITVRDLNKMMIAAGVCKRDADLSAGEVMERIGEVEGKEIAVKFKLKAGNEKDDDGNWKLFQRMEFAAVGEAREAQRADAPGNY